MCSSPLPKSVVEHVSKSNLVYYQDLQLGVYTIEHPLTQRFLKMSERHRIDLIALGSRPGLANLQSADPDMIYHQQFRHLQIPCQDCSQAQSTVFCEQCIASFCDACFKLLHRSGCRAGHTSRPTACGSSCSSCATKKPKVFCSECSDYFCFHCFEELHRRGKRSEHHAMHVSSADGNVAVTDGRKCEECNDVLASLHCDYCKNFFCLTCFWRCHLNGNRRAHTATQVSVRPLCNQCDTTRASVYCEQCQELFCSQCFGDMHVHGGRKLHLFTDAMNILVLLERLDPSYQSFIIDERKRVLRAITKIQACIRAHQQRTKFRRKKESATRIQKRWRGGETRRKMIGALDQFNWRQRAATDDVVHNSAAHNEESIRQEIGALHSRSSVAALEQGRLINKLRTDLGLGETKNMQSESPPIPSSDYMPVDSPKAALQSRFASFHKESEKLRKLLKLEK